MADAFGKFKDSFNRGIASIGAKASNNVEKSKLKSQLETYNKEAEAMIADVGRKAYGIWNSGSNDFSSLEPQFQAIKAKYEAVQVAFNELKQIEERERLANQPAPAPVYGQPQPGMPGVAPVYGAPVNQVTPPVVPAPAPVAPIVIPNEPVAPAEPVVPVAAPVVPAAVPVVPAPTSAEPVVVPSEPVVPVAAPVVPAPAPVVPIVVPNEPVAPVVPAPAPVAPVVVPAAPVEPVAPAQVTAEGCTCPSCGAKFATVINFCRMCGTKINN